MHVDKSFTKIQARVRPPPPIQAMPEFWEHLVLQSLPKEEGLHCNHNKKHKKMTMMFRGRRRIATKNTKQIMFKGRRGIVRFSDSHSFGSSRWVGKPG